MASSGAGQGSHGRGTAQMQKAYEEYQRELLMIQNRGAPIGLSSLSGQSTAESKSRHISESQSSIKSGSGSLETPDTTPTPPGSDSPPARSPSPILLPTRGRGRRVFSGLFNISPGGSGSSGSGSDSTTSPTCQVIAGPLRPPENILLNSPEEGIQGEEDDFIAKFRQMNTASLRGRGRGRGRGLPILTISTDLTQEDVIPRPIGRGRGNPLGLQNLQPNSERMGQQGAHSSSSSCSDVSDDLATLQREVVVKRGTKGKLIPVTCNFIRLKIRRETGMFEYHVDFDPPVESRRASRKILKSMEDILGTVRNFDGAKLYLPFRLQNSKMEQIVENPFDSEKRIKTIIKFVRENKTGACVHFYNILFRRVMERLGLVEMKRNFYDFRATYALPQHKLEIWPGFITAIDEYEGGLMLMCDSSFRVLRTTSLFDVLRNLQSCEQREDTNSTNNVRAKYEEYVVGQIIITKYNNRNYHVDGIDWNQTPLSTFSCKGEEVSYMKYYQQAHGVTIKNTNCPLIEHRSRQSRFDNRRPVTEVVYLVPELCFLTGLSEDITSNIRAMQDMAHFTRISPQRRNTSLQNFIKNVKDSKEASSIMSEWGLELEDNGVELEARQFGFSRLTFGGGIEKDGSADFTRESTSNPCFDPINIKQWAVFCVPQDQDKGRCFIQTYLTVCRNIGIQVNSNANLVIVPSQNGRKYFEAFRKSIMLELNNKKNLQFIVVISPRQEDDLYGMIKKICCVDNPIPSQVILSKTLSNEKRLRSVMAKVALQVNCKLGGALWTIKIPLPERIMFVGMDVYHDPRGKLDSVTALVASLNVFHTKYYSRVVNQRPNQETIDGLRNMFKDALTTYYEDNRAWPDRIVVFRDGVGDGQLDTTAQHEVVQLTETMDQLCDNRPKFTFTVVQKRIHTRIFANEGALVNPGPGTVVDHTVTRRYYYDFFLVSQLHREGTVTPTHYIVLKDNSDIQPDFIQKLAFVTSFMYYNWAGSIRVPAVCQYAHKLAYLVGQHLKTEPAKILSKQLFYL